MSELYYRLLIKLGSARGGAAAAGARWRRRAVDAPAHLHKELGAHALVSSCGVFLTLPAAIARSRHHRLLSNGCVSTLPLFWSFFFL